MGDVLPEGIRLRGGGRTGMVLFSAAVSVGIPRGAGHGSKILFPSMKERNLVPSEANQRVPASDPKNKV